jgi:hypothetical protein
VPIVGAGKKGESTTCCGVVKEGVKGKATGEDLAESGKGKSDLQRGDVAR